MAKLKWYTPNMTASNIPQPYVATASSSSNEAYKAFADFEKITDQWYTVGGQEANAWISLDFGEMVNIDTFRIKAPSIISEAPKSIALEYLSDVNIWEKAHESIEPAWTAYEVRTYSMPKIKASRVRLFIVNNHGARYSSINKLQFGYYEPLDGAIFTKDSQYYSFDTNRQMLTELPNNIDNTKQIYGLKRNTTIDFAKKYYDKIKVDYIPETESFAESIVNIPEGYYLYDYLGDKPSIECYSESNSSLEIKTKTESFSPYSYFSDNIEILNYTENISSTSSELYVDANYSPLDSLQEDFTVYSWLNDSQNKEKQISIKAIPSPQFIHPIETFKLSDKPSKISVVDNSSYILSNNTRYLLTGDNLNWYTYKNEFIKIGLNETDILSQGMTATELNNLTRENLSNWTSDSITVGVFLKDEKHYPTESSFKDISVSFPSYVSTSTVEDVSFYILNTTASIDINFSGLTLMGTVSDADLTKVQYRVKLNNKSYYPASGEFTPLSSPPANINLSILSTDILIGDWNDLEVEFKDSFGSVDTWSARFIGKYAGLIFKDTGDNIYSTDLGQVLQYLDFGTVLTGQITPSYQVKIKNEYGFDVTNAKLSINKKNFPDGLNVQLSINNTDFVDSKDFLIGDLKNDEEISFFVRLTSTASTIPNSNTTFDIVVMAERAI